METDEILGGAECCWELVWIYPWAGSPAPQATSLFLSVTPFSFASCALVWNCRLPSSTVLLGSCLPSSLSLLHSSRPLGHKAAVYIFS